MTAIPHPSFDPAMAARLLGRALVTVDDASLREAVGGRRVLITGGGGSIGAELARLLAGLDVAGLTLLDHSERALFWVG